MKDNEILFKLLEQLLSNAEDGECAELEKFGEEAEPDEELEIEEPSEDVEESGDDEDSERMKKFLAALKG